MRSVVAASRFAIVERKTREFGRHPIGLLRLKAQIFEVEFSNRSIVQYERVSPGCIGAFVAAASPRCASRDQIEESYARVACARSFVRQCGDERERE